MTEYEYDSMMKFLDRLIHIRTAAKDLTAERRIKQALERQPFAGYFLVQRAMSLELALDAAREKIKALEGKQVTNQPSPQLSSFLGGGELAWGGNLEALEVRQSPHSSEPTADARPSHITLEDKCLRFIGNNTAAIWIGIAVAGLLAALFKP